MTRLLLFFCCCGGLTAQTDAAVRRGVEFIGGIADNRQYFAENGDDLLHFYAELSATSSDATLRKLARVKGRGLALRWQQLHPAVPSHASPDALLSLVTGEWASEQLGAPHSKLREQIRQAAGRFSARDFLGFDAGHESPPANLAVSARYDLWCDALITSFTGDLLGVVLGAPYAQVARWLPTMRPYPKPVTEREFYSVTYAITHTIYTRNRYNADAVDRDCLRPEFEFLLANLPEAMRLKDAETTGEFLDTLRAFGLSTDDPLIRQGTEFLLAVQNPDGSWGAPGETDIYTRYHSTWTAIDGLRGYRFRPAGPCAIGPGR